MGASIHLRVGGEAQEDCKNIYALQGFYTCSWYTAFIMSRGMDKVNMVEKLLARRKSSTKKPITFLLGAETVEALEAAAKHIGISRIAVGEYLLEDFLELTGFLHSSDRRTLSMDSFTNWIPGMSRARQMSRKGKITNRQNLKRLIRRKRKKGSLPEDYLLPRPMLQDQ